jgi:hypothetical protein
MQRAALSSKSHGTAWKRKMNIFFPFFFGLSQLRENRRRGASKKKPEMANQMVCMMRNLLVYYIHRRYPST